MIWIRAGLLLAYANGIFPWYNDGQPILWFSPDPRFVLYPDQLHVGRSLRKTIRRGAFEIRMDTAFAEVIRQCRRAQRPGQSGTWITDDMEAAYSTLHKAGYAHSAEAWLDGELVGGLYGVALGQLYSGESMFAHRSDASKVAFVWMARQLQAWGLQAHRLPGPHRAPRPLRRRGLPARGLPQAAPRPRPRALPRRPPGPSTPASLPSERVVADPSPPTLKELRAAVSDHGAALVRDAPAAQVRPEVVASRAAQPVILGGDNAAPSW